MSIEINLMCCMLIVLNWIKMKTNAEFFEGTFDSYKRKLFLSIEYIEINQPTLIESIKLKLKYVKNNLDEVTQESTTIL